MRFSFVLLLSFLILAGCNSADESTARDSTVAPADSTEISGTESKLTVGQAREYARDAYVFLYPIVLNYRTMYSQAIKGDAEFGQWLHLGTATPDDTDIVTPNNDTPYSYAWVDLRAEPWVLTLPAIDENRYYTSQWDDLWAYVLDNPGSLNDGNGGGSYLLVSPEWNGEVPVGISRAIRGESQFLGTLTRTQLIGGLEDLENVRAIQQEYELAPLSTFLGTAAPEPATPIDWPVWTEGDEKTDKFWSYADFLLQFTTRNPVDAAEYEKLAALSIGLPGDFNMAGHSPEIQEAIRQGAADAQAEFVKAGNDPTLDSGKLFASREKSGTDYLDRALGVALGIFGNVNEQAVYFSIPLGADNQPLDASKHDYSVTFADGQTPPVKYFWSFTMYRVPERWLVANPIERYSLSSTTPGLKTGEDGSMTIYFQHASPGDDKESNWLPAPDGPFWLVLRNYGPDDSIINGAYPKPKPMPVE